MAKELPYYKFEVLAYLTGDISLERWELQGIFNNVCAFYWSKNCEISLAILFKKYAGHEHLIKELIDLDIFKIDDEGDEDFLSINFLNEQWASKETQKIVNTINGKKGGRPSKKQKQTETITEIKPNQNPNKTDSVILNQIDTENKPNGFNFANQNHNRTITNIEESREEERKGKEEEIKNNLSFDEFTVLDNEEENPSAEIINLGNTEVAADLVEKINAALIDWFEFKESHYYRQQVNISKFVNLLNFGSQLEHFDKQFEAYKAYKIANGNRHSMAGFIGTESQGFKDGKWNDENWIKRLESYEEQKTSTSKPKAGIVENIGVLNNVNNPFEKPNEQQ